MPIAKARVSSFLNNNSMKGEHEASVSKQKAGSRKRYMQRQSPEVESAKPPKISNSRKDAVEKR